jgi:hypothetical protein
VSIGMVEGLAGRRKGGTPCGASDEEVAPAQAPRQSASAAKENAGE